MCAFDGAIHGFTSAHGFICEIDAAAFGEHVHAVRQLAARTMQNGVGAHLGGQMQPCNVDIRDKYARTTKRFSRLERK